MKTKTDILKLAQSAVMIALAALLSTIKILPMQMGGAVTPMSMLPIVIIAIKYGTRWGITVSGTYAVLQIILDAGLVFAWGLNIPTLLACFCLDYILAFGVLGLAGLWRKNGIAGQYAGIALVLFLRFAAHFTSGLVLFGNWTDGLPGAVIYSLMYNGSYMLPELILTLIGATLLLKAPYIKRLFVIQN